MINVIDVNMFLQYGLAGLAIYILYVIYTKNINDLKETIEKNTEVLNELRATLERNNALLELILQYVKKDADRK